MSGAPLKRTGELRSAEELTRLTGAGVSPGQIRVPTRDGAFFKVRKTKPPQWRFYREIKP